MNQQDRPAPRRGRTRSQQTQQAIIQAAAELLVERGPRAMSVDAVAARAGASKATIYRWWPSKEALILDACRAKLVASPSQIGDVGSLASELLASVRARIALFDQLPTLARTMAELFAAAHDDPAFAAAYASTVVEPVRGMAREIVTRSIRRGEIAPDTEVELVLDLVFGALNLRILQRHAPADEQFARSLVGLVCQAIGAETDALDALPSVEQPMRLAGTPLHEQRHIGAFIDGADDDFESLMPFIAEGLARGEKAVHIIDPTERAKHVERLEAAGIAVTDAQRRGQFDLHVWDEAFLRAGYFDPEAMLVWLRATLNGASAQGFPLTRLVAHMEWTLDGRHGSESLMTYEARLNQTLPMSRDVVICLYDTTKFSGELLLDAIRTHPVVLVDGRVHTNPLFVPPDEFVRDRRARRGPA